MWVTAVSGPSDSDPCEWWIVVTVHWEEGALRLLWTSDLWPDVLEHRQTIGSRALCAVKKIKKRNSLRSSPASLIHINVSISDTNAVLMRPADNASLTTGKCQEGRGERLIGGGEWLGERQKKTETQPTKAITGVYRRSVADRLRFVTWISANPVWIVTNLI